MQNTAVVTSASTSENSQMNMELHDKHKARLVASHNAAADQALLQGQSSENAVVTPIKADRDLEALENLSDLPLLADTQNSDDESLSIP